MTAGSDFDVAAYRGAIEDMSLEHLQRLDEQAAALQEQLAAINEQRRLIRGVLRTLNPPAPKPHKPQAAGKKLSSAKVQAVREYIEGLSSDVNITSPMVAQNVGLNKDAATTALRALRDGSFLRLAGRGPGKGAPIIYRKMDVEAVAGNGG